MKTNTRSFYETVVERTVERIVSALDDALDLGTLARQAGLSPFHFHRVFRGMLGETPLEMHRRLRLERAAARLQETDVAVTTLAFEAGYETHEAFTRIFRQAFALSPSAFRDRAADPSRSPLRRPTELAARSGVHFHAPPGALSLHFSRGEIAMNVTIEEMPALRVAAVRHVGPYNQISEAFARLGDIAGASDFLRHGGMMLAIYYDDPEATPADQLQSDAGLSIPEGIPLPPGLTEKRLPAGRYAKTTHLGPYATLGDSWARFMGEWLPSSGMRLLGEGSSFEVYRNHPGNAAPEDLRTDLYLPLA